MKTLQLAAFLPAVARLAPLSLVLLVGCAAEDDEGPAIISGNPIVLELADCTALGIRETNDIAMAVLDLIDAIDDPTMPPSGVTYDPMTGAFALDLDLDRDGTTDTMIDGQIQTPFSQLDDGFQEGESFAFDWTAMGSFAGGGALTITHQPASIRLVGTSTLVDPGGCEFAISNLNASLFEQAGGIEANGLLEFDSQTSAGTMSGVASFVPDEDAFVSANSQGETAFFYVDLVTFQVYAE